MRVLVMIGDSRVEVVSVVPDDGGPTEWTHTAGIQPWASGWPMGLSQPVGGVCLAALAGLQAYRHTCC
jgi:hypothetical protein